MVSGMTPAKTDEVKMSDDKNAPEITSWPETNSGPHNTACPDRFDLWKWLSPGVDPEHMCLDLGEGHFAWLHTRSDCELAVRAWMDKGLPNFVCDTNTKDGRSIHVTGAIRLGVVLRRDGMVTRFCVDIDRHDGGGPWKLTAKEEGDVVDDMFGCYGVRFTSKSGKGLHIYYAAPKPIAVEIFCKWAKNMGYNKPGGWEVFPKTAGLSQVWLPNKPVGNGDHWNGGMGDGQTWVVRRTPNPVPPPVTIPAVQPVEGANKTEFMGWTLSYFTEYVEKMLAGYNPRKVNGSDGWETWELETCPFNTHENRFCSIVGWKDGALNFFCHHAGCADNRWRQLREMHMPIRQAVDIPGPAKGAERKPKGRRYSSVERKERLWLWKGWFALGELFLWYGDPGETKSLLAVHFGAKASAGLDWMSGAPLGREKTDTIILNCEDDAERDMKPRLDNAGADQDHVHEFGRDFDDGGKDKKWTLSDIDVLKKYIEQTGAELIFLDPLYSIMPPGLNVNHPEDIRAALEPLAKLARDLQVCIVVIHHTNKGGLDVAACNRISGSQQIRGVVRGMWMVLRDRRTDDKVQRYAIISLKFNIHRDGHGLLYHIQSLDEDNIKIVVDRPADCTADELIRAGYQLAGSAKRKDVGEEMLEKLVAAGGELPATEMEAWLDECGFARMTWKRAKFDRGIESYQKEGSWWWKAPKKPEYQRSEAVS